MDYRALAEKALEARSEAASLRSKAHKAGKTDLVREYDRQIEARLAEAREHVEAAEREDENRALMGRAGALANPTPGSLEGDGNAWRGMLPSLSEMREQAETRDVLGSEFIIPDGTATKYVDALRGKAVFLRGIPAENLIPFNERNWSMPILSDTDMPGLVQENALIVEGDDTWAGLEFNSKKYADLRGASNETFADSSLALRNVLADTLIRNVSTQFDADAFTGAGGTTTPILGLIGQGNSVEVGSAAGDLPTWDDLADAVNRIWVGNAEPTVIWAAPDAATALAKEREGSEGARLEGDSPLNVARNLPTLVSTHLPTGAVVVAAGNRIFAGIRSGAQIAVSSHADFESDRTLVRLTLRAAGTLVAETSSVQVLTANDGV